MKRVSDRDASPFSKRSRSSLGHYDESSDDERGGPPPPRRRRSPSPSHRSRYPLPPDPPVLRERDDYPPPRSRPPPPSTGYKTLCVSSIHPKASDEVVKDSLYREFKKYGEVSIKLVHGAEPEDRLAYVSFRNPEDAREARHSKQRIILYDKPAVLEPVYETSTARSTRARSRSYSPLPYRGEEERYIRPRSPDDRHRMYDDRYDYSLRGYGPPPPAGMYRDYRPPPYDYPPRGPSSYRGHSYYGAGGHPPVPHYERGSERGGGSRGGGGGGAGGGGGGGGGGRNEEGGGRGDRNHDRYENKKDRFPNYLHHIPPEEDPLATRTLFAGNLEINITEEELRRIFGNYGIVEDVDIKRPPPGTGNAYAFVRFENLDQANRCKVELSGQYIGKFQVKIGYGKATPTTRIWVGGLGSWTSLAQLEREFDRFGAIKKIEYNKGDTSAYILYETIEAAQAAVQDMRGFCLGGPDRKLKTDFVDTNPPTAHPPTAKSKGSSSSYDAATARSGAGEDYAGSETNWNNGDDPNYRTGSSRTGRGNRSGYEKRPNAYRGSGAEGDDWPANSSRRPPPDEFDSARGGSRSPSNERRTDEGGRFTGYRTLAEVARRSPSNWTGALVLKNSFFPTKLHVTSGEASIADLLLHDEKNQPHLRITQRLRLDPPKLEDVSRRVSASASHAIFLGLPGSTGGASSPTSDEAAGVQNRPLRNLVTYLKQKEAAGVISLANKNADVTGVLYAFPPCQFAADLLRRAAPSLTDETLKDDHLVIVVVKAWG
uniref:EOG090X04VI n=1 Tax=Daphnia similis TaxID=35528 RepID=A0A4Y7LWB9_9CRUS|nr:EOG090X04VI [Daphnia similis]